MTDSRRNFTPFDRIVPRRTGRSRRRPLRETSEGPGNATRGQHRVARDNRRRVFSEKEEGVSGTRPGTSLLARIAIAVLAVLLLPASASAQLPPSLDAARIQAQIVAVRVYDGNRLEWEGTGVLVNAKGDILTSAAGLDAGPRVSVLAQGSAELAAEQKMKEDGSGFAVLQAKGLRGPGLPLSLAALAPNTRIFSVLPPATSPAAGIVAGAAGSVVNRSAGGTRKARFLRHNAIVPRSGYGSPTIDECGRIVALNLPDSEDTSWRFQRHVEPKGVMFALAASEIAQRLDTLGVEFASATDACASAEQRAEKKAQEAKKAAEKAKKEREAKESAQKKAKEAQQQTKRAREEARRLELEKQRAEQESLEAAAREAEERKRTERLRRLAVWGGGAGGLLVLALVLAGLMSARRKRRAMHAVHARAAEAEREAAMAQRRLEDLPEPAPFDCVLTGVDSEGAPFALNVRRDALGDPAGVVVGRNPAGSSHVVADPSVSREHARLYVEGGTLYVEDLGSTNGTALSGRTLEAGQPAQVGDGDSLIFGSVRLRIAIEP